MVKNVLLSYNTIIFHKIYIRAYHMQSHKTSIVTIESSPCFELSWLWKYLNNVRLAKFPQSSEVS